MYAHNAKVKINRNLLFLYILVKYILSIKVYLKVEFTKSIR